MRVRFPLSLKVTVWLLLNLLLLAAAALAFLISQGGVGWDSLVAGAAGDRLHELAGVIAGEVAAAPTGERDAVLARFGTAYGADLFLMRNRGPQLAGQPTPVPPAVRQRLEEGPAGPRGPAPWAQAAHRAQAMSPRPPPERAGAQGASRGRFLVHGDGWWLGMRVPFAVGELPPAPATLLIHARSFTVIVKLLNLETWVFAAASVLVISILFWLPLVRSITRALRTLTTATGKIADGRFDTRVDTRRHDELGHLGEAVNAMAARLDGLVNGQKRFLADVAHELGSPLARLQVATALLEERAAAELRPHVADVREEVDQMAALVEELLTFTKAGLHARAAVLLPVEVDALAAAVVAREDPTRRVQVVVAPGLQVLGDEPLLARALANLVRNALRYTGEATAISLVARRDRDRVLVVVEDEGPGVPAAALSRLGEPFYRPDIARTSGTGGAGLGLAIVRSSVAACGGTVHFSNRSPCGFRAELSLAPA